ncbi:MAG: lytic transglycosylase domain-containing protein [Hydrogenophilus sp.]|nr:lytic transglycosylase domain-containing protein [Hydrogenophilus sp.]
MASTGFLLSLLVPLLLGISAALAAAAPPSSSSPAKATVSPSLSSSPSPRSAAPSPRPPRAARPSSPRPSGTSSAAAGKPSSKPSAVRPSRSKAAVAPTSTPKSAVPSSAPSAATYPSSQDPVGKARDAFARGDLPQLLSLEPHTRGDPLAPYVTAWRLTLQILRADPTPDPREIETFLQQHAATAAADRVRRAQAQQYIRQGLWGEALHTLQQLTSHDLSSRCWLAHAELMNNPTAPGHRGRALERLAATSRLNEDCAGYVTALLALEIIPPDALLARALATHFEHGFDAAQPWLALLDLDTAQIARRLALFEKNLPDLSPPPSPLSREEAVALAAALIRHARQNPHRAWNLRSLLPPPLADAVARAAYLVAARQNLPEARAWAEHFPSSPIWREPERWRLRRALADDEWHRFLTYLAHLPTDERERRDWRFWRAWALKATGDTAAARSLLESLVRQDDFWGLLAGELIGAPLSIVPDPAPSPLAVAVLQRDPHLALIRALAARGWHLEARREAEHYGRAHAHPMHSERRRAAAELLHRDGEHDLAIRLLDAAEDLKAWTLRYPTPWKATLLKIAAAEQIDPAWAYGVMRQESRFRADARSSAGALGLMQVMPATGQWLAKKLGEPAFRPHQLLEPETNVRFGITYLRLMSEQLDGHPVLATGAYNAGPGRIQRLRRTQDLTADAELLEALRYIELIPIDETRDYIRKVLANTVIYSHLLGNPQPITRWLLPDAQQAARLAAIQNTLTPERHP